MRIKITRRPTIPHPLRRPLQDEKGVALLISVFAITMMIFIAMEVSYDTQVEYLVASQSVNRLKAYYAAKAGAELSLLRIQIYKKAVATYGDQLKDNISMLDPIWNFPFAWPPSGFLPEGMTKAEKDIIKDIEKESSLQATYVTTIESEGSRIDVNDLGSASEALRESTKKQILEILAQYAEGNDDFSNNYSTTDFEELVNNMMDWVDEDSEGRNGGSEKSAYPDIQSDFVPPNQPFKTIDELHEVAGMTDEIFNLLRPRITVFGVNGINVNYASADVLKSLDKQIDDEIVAEIIKRRSNQEEGGPFKNQDDFIQFLDGFINTGTFNQSGIPLYFDSAEHNFRVTSTGQFANVTREITLITFDLDAVKERYIEVLDKDFEKRTNKETDDKQDDTKKKDQNNNTNPEDANKNSEKDKSESKKVTPKGRPIVVYWWER